MVILVWLVIITLFFCLYWFFFPAIERAMIMTNARSTIHLAAPDIDLIPAATLVRLVNLIH